MTPDPSLLIDEPTDHAVATLILAHGAGAPMDSPFMTTMAALLATRGLRVVRFEFPYMHRRRVDGVRQPPNRQPVLLDGWREVYGAVTQRFAGPVLVGGKSMGGRMATLVADELRSAGVVCLGYPAHPPGKPETQRTAVLESMTVPTLIVQGERDPFGRRDELERPEVSGSASGAASKEPTWSPQVEWLWSPDGDHDLKPRKASGRTHDDNLDAAADGVAQWWQRVQAGSGGVAGGVTERHHDLIENMSGPEKITALAVDSVLDATELFCPEPVMLLHNAMRDLEAGQILKVRATDASTRRDIPKFCLFLDHDLMTSIETDGEFHFLIRKGGAN